MPDAVVADVTPELEVVRHLVARRLDRPDDAIVRTHRLQGDLGLSLLSLAVIALEVEDVTGVLLPFEPLSRAQTVEDLARLLHLTRRR